MRAGRHGSARPSTAAPDTQGEGTARVSPWTDQGKGQPGFCPWAGQEEEAAGAQSMGWPGEGSARGQPLVRLGRWDGVVGTAGASATEPAWEWGQPGVSPWTSCHLACFCWLLSHPNVPALALAWELATPKPLALLCCLGCSLIRNSSELTSPWGLSCDVVTWERPRVRIPCGTFVSDLATRGSWNCCFSVTLPNIKNKFLCFLVRKSMLCAAHLPSPAGEPGLDSFGLMGVGVPLGVGFSQNCS